MSRGKIRFYDADHNQFIPRDKYPIYITSTSNREETIMEAKHYASMGYDIAIEQMTVSDFLRNTDKYRSDNDKNSIEHLSRTPRQESQKHNSYSVYRSA